MAMSVPRAPVVFLCLILFGGATPVSAFTLLDSDINENTTLVASSSPYLVNENIVVNADVTLTVEAGVVVKFGNSRGLDVQGSLVVNGNDNAPVYFTSSEDDVGGDTNGNGSSTVPTTQDWNGIKFLSGSTGELNNTTIRYAGYRRSRVKPTPAVTNEGGQVSIVNSVISDSNYAGIGQTSGSLTLDSSTIASHTYGLVLTGGDATLTNSIINDTQNTGLLARNLSTLNLTDNQFSNNFTTIDVDISDAPSLSFAGNSATGGSLNGIVLRGQLSSSLVLPKSTLPYVVSDSGGLDTSGSIEITTNNNLAVASGGSLSLPAGSIVKFSGSGARLEVAGNLIALGTVDQKIYFTSIKDDTVGGDTDGAAATPAPGDWQHLVFQGGSSAGFEFAVVKYGGHHLHGGSRAGLYNQGGVVTFDKGEIGQHHSYGFYHSSGTSTINNTLITNNPVYGVLNTSQSVLDAKNNGWGDASGPYHPSLNPNGLGDQVSDNVDFEPWGIGCLTDCFSNVMFLPGIMSSRLYLDDKQLWEGRDDEVDYLYLDNSGQSINSGVYTKDVIGTFDGVLNIDIYDSFLTELATLKTAGTIVDYAATPYDWRLSLSDIIDKGTETDGKINYSQATSTPYLEQTLRRLAASSKTGEVTIITHSNGGLVAKALINKLGNEADGLIDNLVLIGVPQIGTPKAIGSLLNGYKAGIKFQVSDAKARDFSVNTPMIYQLLPHESYFERAGISESTPLFTFVSGEPTVGLINKFGSTLDSYTELKSLILAEEGRSWPTYDDLEAPAIGNRDLYNATETVLDAVGASWQPPSGVHVHQLAGVGEETVSGFTYEIVQKCAKHISFRCIETKDTLSPVPVFTYDGDGTVVELSAHTMDDTPSNVSKWWANLFRYNDTRILRAGPLRLQHADMMYMDEMHTWALQEILQSKGSQNYLYISKTKPVLEKKHSIIFKLFSPLDISLTTADGQVVDKNNPAHPNATYERYGEVQIVHVYGDEPFTINLDGLSEGSFTLAISEYDANGVVVNTKTYSAIPSTADTTATLSAAGSTIAELGELQLDYGLEALVATSDTEPITSGGLYTGGQGPYQLIMVCNL